MATTNSFAGQTKRATAVGLICGVGNLCGIITVSHGMVIAKATGLTRLRLGSNLPHRMGSKVCYGTYLWRSVPHLTPASHQIHPGYSWHDLLQCPWTRPDNCTLVRLPSYQQETPSYL